MDNKSKQIATKCGVLGKECIGLETYFKSMVYRLSLNFSTDECMRTIEEKLQIITDGVEDLKEELEVDSDG